MLEHLPASQASERVLRLREGLGLTQARLAELLGVSVASVIRWEHGRSQPSELAWQRFLDMEREAVPPALSVVSLSSPPWTNLPAPLTSFIGREAELRDVLALLSSARLLTLTGAGGSGKTRLALEAAREVTGEGSKGTGNSGDGARPESFEDGVWLVELAAIADPALVPQAIAAALRVPEEPGRSLSETLGGFLKTRRLLLVLDNFEHLVESAPLLSHLLSAAPRIEILVTSRVLLRISGEQSFVVPPLPLTAPAETADHDALMQSEAVRLFAERAQSANAGFALDGESAPAVVQICNRLDGLPLGIELAAARVRLLTPQMLLSRLQNRLALLTSGPRNAAERHQTLRNAIAWSYDLLGEPERVLFGRLAVFAGGCTLESVEGVCGSDALGGLATLLDSSLLQRRPQENGEPRFVMLETIRDFALERLVASGEEAETRRRHAEYFLNLAEAAAPCLRGPQRAESVALLHREYDNLRLVLGRSTDAGAERTAGLRLAWALYWFWYLQGRFDEGRAWLDRLLESSEAAPAPLRANALFAAGLFAWCQFDFGRSALLLAESLELYREAGDAAGIGFVLNQQAYLARDQGDYQQAERLHREASEHFRAAAEPWGIALTRTGLAQVAGRQGRYDQATILAEEALGHWRALGETWGVSFVLTLLAAAALERGEYARATSLYEDGLAVRCAIGESGAIAGALGSLARVALRQGDCRRAAEFDCRSLALYWEAGHKAGVASCVERIAWVATHGGRARQAARLLGGALALREGIGTPLSPADVPLYEQWFDSTRAALRPKDFEALQMEGGSLPLAELVAAALREATEAATGAIVGIAGPAQVREGYPSGLTSREVEVLRLIASGYSNRQIAEQLVISVHTVERHIATIHRKIDRHGKASATAYALAHGLMDAP